jgi:uncharacterized protein YdiU (UPF0061 family)
MDSINPKYVLRNYRLAIEAAEKEDSLIEVVLLLKILSEQDKYSKWFC